MLHLHALYHYMISHQYSSGGPAIGPVKYCRWPAIVPVKSFGTDGTTGSTVMAGGGLVPVAFSCESVFPACTYRYYRGMTAAVRK